MVPVRQWILSLPQRVRYLLSRYPDLGREVRGIFTRAVQSFYIRRAKAEGFPDGRCGAVIQVQRFDSAIRLYPHFHGIFLDGVYTGFESTGVPLTFHRARHLTDPEVESMVRHIQALIFGHLRRRGHLDDQAKLLTESEHDLDELGIHHAASVQGAIPFGERSGQQATLFGEPSSTSRHRRRRSCAPTTRAIRSTQRSVSEREPARDFDSRDFADTS